MSEAATLEREKISAERLSEAQTRYENLGSQITDLRAQEREAGEEYARLLQATAESGRIVI